MYQRILVPLDGSATSRFGLDSAMRLAALTGGRLRLLHVVDELSFALAMDVYSAGACDWLGRLRADGARILEAGARQAREAGVAVETVLVDTFRGRIHERVAAEARAWPADLIVLGTHGRRGIGRLVLGSDAENILRGSPVPVLLVRRPAEDAPLREAVAAETEPATTLAATPS